MNRSPRVNKSMYLLSLLRRWPPPLFSFLGYAVPTLSREPNFPSDRIGNLSNGQNRAAVVVRGHVQNCMAEAEATERKRKPLHPGGTGGGDVGKGRNGMVGD